MVPGPIPLDGDALRDGNSNIYSLRQFGEGLREESHAYQQAPHASVLTPAVI